MALKWQRSLTESQVLAQCLCVKTRGSFWVMAVILGGSPLSPLEWLRSPWHHWTQSSEDILGAVGFHGHWALTTWHMSRSQTHTEKPYYLGEPLLDVPSPHVLSLKINEREDPHRVLVKLFALPLSLFLGKYSILGICILTYAYTRVYLSPVKSGHLKDSFPLLNSSWEFPQEVLLSNMSLTSCVEGYVGPVIWWQPLSSSWWMRPHLHDHMDYRISADIC